VLRRTVLGAGGAPSETALAACARLLAAELGWSRERSERELAAVRAVYPGWAGGADA
jgi:hypothetical protein